MGWAIRRSDGTYRCWNANARDDVLLPNEAWEERTAKPEITIPPPTDTDHARRFDDAILLRTVVAELLNVIDARHPAYLVDRVAFRTKVIARLRA